MWKFNIILLRLIIRFIFIIKFFSCKKLIEAINFEPEPLFVHMVGVENCTET